MFPKTKLIHLTPNGNSQLSCKAEILSCTFPEKEEEKSEQTMVEVILDSTSMHPQGGGQPSDIGWIILNDDNGTKIEIKHVSLDKESGVITHHGVLSGKEPIPPLPATGSMVNVQVDEKNRRILSECHTAGHVIDAAMEGIGMKFPATKGYHFLDGPYVEYKGKLASDINRDEFVKKLQEAFQELVDQDIRTDIELLSKEEAESKCNRLAQNYSFPETDESIRIVTIASLPCPCGGTHVSSTMDLKENKWNVIGIRNKKGILRIRYGMEK